MDPQVWKSLLFLSLSCPLTYCPPIYLCIKLSIYLIIIIFIYLLIYLISIYLSIYLSVCLSVCLSIYLSIYLSLSLSIYLSIYLSFYLFHQIIYLTWTCASGNTFSACDLPNMVLKWCVSIFWRGNVLRATTACTFSASDLPKVVRKWFVLGVFCTFWHGHVLRIQRGATFNFSSGETARCPPRATGCFLAFSFFKATFGKDHARSFLQDGLENLGFPLCEWIKLIRYILLELPQCGFAWDKNVSS